MKLFCLMSYDTTRLVTIEIHRWASQISLKWKKSTFSHQLSTSCQWWLFLSNDQRQFNWHWIHCRWTFLHLSKLIITLVRRKMKTETIEYTKMISWKYVDRTDRGKKQKKSATADVFLITFISLLIIPDTCILLFRSLNSLSLALSLRRDIQSNDEHTLGSSFYCSFTSLEQA